MRVYQKVKRFRHVFSVLVKYGFEDIVSRLRIPLVRGRSKQRIKRTLRERILNTPLAERLRLICEELGPTFIKLGQILSIRSDVIPENIALELRKLQDGVTPFPVEELDDIFTEQFHKPIQELYRSFDYNAYAAASIAQVHRAVTPDGKEVAVKVQRPRISAEIEADLDILLDLAGLLERHVPALRAYRPVAIVKEFSKTIRLELDFRYEARNTDLFREKFFKDDSVHIPEIYWELTSEKVLTMEHISGVKLTDLQALREPRFNRRTIAVNGTNMLLKQIFEYGFFHADPHPGNILVMENNIIAPLDFGIVGFIDNQLKEHLVNALSAFAERDVDRFMHVFGDMGLLEDSVDLHGLRHDFNTLMHYYYSMPISQIHIGQLLKELHTIVRNYHIYLPVDFVLMTKALITAETIGHELVPDFDISVLVKPFIHRLMLSRLDPKRNIERLVGTFGDVMHLMGELPAELRMLLKKMKAGKLKFQFEHKGLENFISETDRSVNRLSFSIVIAAITIGSSLIIHLNVGPRIFGLPAIGLVGFLLAGFSGILLIYAIIRSGRL